MTTKKPQSENEQLDEKPSLEPETEDQQAEEEPEIEYPIVINLKSPLKEGKRVIDTLELNELTAGDMLGISMSDEFSMADILKMIGRSALLPPSICKQLRPRDLNECIAAVKTILAPIQGEESSSDDLDT